MPGATRSVLIQAPMAKVYQVISDYERYPAILPQCKGVRVSHRQGNQVNVHYTIEVIKTIHYALHMLEGPPKRLSWSFVEGEIMKDNKGSWLLEEKGGATLTTYSIEMTLP